jgi:hypothetical protein
MVTDIVSADPHVEHLVCRGLRVAFIPPFSVGRRVRLHGPGGSFSVVIRG